MSKNQPLDQKRRDAAGTPNPGTKVVNIFESDRTLMEELLEFAASVPDHRRAGKGNFRHVLAHIIVLEVLARLCGCVSRADIIDFGENNLRKFKSMGMLLNGVPSEPTLSREGAGIDHEAMACQLERMCAVFRSEAGAGGGEAVCIDGKAMRGTVNADGRNPDILSAYSTRSGMAFATEMCGEKSNELTAAPRLLERLDLNGCVVTADAMFCHKDIMDQVRNCGGNFVIELKANQKTLRYGLEDELESAVPADMFAERPDLAHGRIESRTCRVFDGRGLLRGNPRWDSSLTVVEVLAHTQRKTDGEQASDRRLYLSSLGCRAKENAAYTRGHWGVESMHWTLDCTLFQDKIRRKKACAARNLDTLQKAVLALIAAWKTRRRKKADKKRGTKALKRRFSAGFTALMRFLAQKKPRK